MSLKLFLYFYMQKYIKTLILYVLAILFHNTSIIAILTYIIIAIDNTTKINKRSKAIVENSNFNQSKLAIGCIIGELSEFATNYAETLAKTTGHIACITDKDNVIAVSGISKKEFLERDISKELEELMDEREVYTSNKNNDMSIPIIKNDSQERKFNAQVIYPIISQGDVIGSVVLISKDQKKKMTETEEKVAQSAAGFLSNQMEI